MIPPKGAPEIRDYFLIVCRSWVVLLCATALAAGLGWVAWQREVPIYSANTKVLIQSQGNATPLDALYGQINAESRIVTYQWLARSVSVTGPTIDQLGLAATTDELAGRISIPLSTTAVMDVVVRGTDADETQRVAEAVTANLIAESHNLLDVDKGGTELAWVDHAATATREGSLTQRILQATAFGFVISLVLVIAWGLLRDRLLGRRQVERVVDGALER